MMFVAPRSPPLSSAATKPPQRNQMHRLKTASQSFSASHGETMSTHPPSSSPPHHNDGEGQEEVQHGKDSFEEAVPLLCGDATLKVIDAIDATAQNRSADLHMRMDQIVHLIDASSRRLVLLHQRRADDSSVLKNKDPVSHASGEESFRKPSGGSSSPRSHRAPPTSINGNAPTGAAVVLADVVPLAVSSPRGARVPSLYTDGGPTSPPAAASAMSLPDAVGSTPVREGATPMSPSPPHLQACSRLSSHTNGGLSNSDVDFVVSLLATVRSHLMEVISADAAYGNDLQASLKVLREPQTALPLQVSSIVSPSRHLPAFPAPVVRPQNSSSAFPSPHLVNSNGDACSETSIELGFIPEEGDDGVSALPGQSAFPSPLKRGGGGRMVGSSNNPSGLFHLSNRTPTARDAPAVQRGSFFQKPRLVDQREGGGHVEGGSVKKGRRATEERLFEFDPESESRLRQSTSTGSTSASSGASRRGERTSVLALEQSCPSVFSENSVATSFEAQHVVPVPASIGGQLRRRGRGTDKNSPQGGGEDISFPLFVYATAKLHRGEALPAEEEVDDGAREMVVGPAAVRANREEGDEQSHQQTTSPTGAPAAIDGMCASPLQTGGALPTAPDAASPSSAHRKDAIDGGDACRPWLHHIAVASSSLSIQSSLADVRSSPMGSRAAVGSGANAGSMSHSGSTSSSFLAVALMGGEGARQLPGSGLTNPIPASAAASFDTRACASGMTEKPPPSGQASASCHSLPSVGGPEPNLMCQDGDDAHPLPAIYPSGDKVPPRSSTLSDTSNDSR